MIKKGNKIKLYPYYNNQNKPEEYVGIKEIKKNGKRCFMCNVIDMGYDALKKKKTTKFVKARIDCDFKIEVGDELIVDEILGIAVSDSGMFVVFKVSKYADGIEPSNDTEFNPFL